MKTTTAKIRSTIISVYALYGCIASCTYGLIRIIPAFWENGLLYEDQVSIAIMMALIFIGFLIAAFIRNSNIQSQIRFKEYAVHSSLNRDHIEEIGRSNIYAGDNWLGYAQGVEYRFWHRSEIQSIEYAFPPIEGKKQVKLKLVTKDKRTVFLIYAIDADMDLLSELRSWLYKGESYAEQMSMALDEPQEKTEAVPTQTKGVSRTFKIAAVILIAALILLLFFVILMYMKNRHSMPQQSNDGYYLYVMSKIQPYING
ncbi:MAG: hypothetical protein GX685_11765 [Clostridiales bacterium]|nr:hypothetical protein [Clostridiales bacterium]